jgi:hypothetical protein
MSLRWSFDLFGWPGYKDASPTGFPKIVKLQHPKMILAAAVFFARCEIS